MRRLIKPSPFLKALFLFCFTGALLSTPANAADPAPSKVEPVNASQVQKPTWKKVENSKVCMVTDMLFPRDQIPVQVSGKTYYGCCEDCKARLGKDESIRFAVDPISKKKVDKAKATIAAGPDGNVLYFENEANFKKFLSSN